MTNEKREKAWGEIVSSIILGGATVLAAMLPLYCSSQRRLEAVTETADNETEALRKQLAETELKLQRCEEEEGDALVDSPRVDPPDPPPSVTSAVDHDFKFDLKECRLEGSTVRCNFLVADLMGDRELSLAEGRIIDAEGNEYPAEEFELGAQSGGFARMVLPSGVSIKGAVKFSSVRPETKHLEVVEITGYNWPASGASRETVVAKFRKVDL